MARQSHARRDGGQARSEIVLFHSALGRRPAVLEFAAALRGAGHEVHTPDLYDGEVFEDLEKGMAKRDALGRPEIARRALAAVADLPTDLVYAGFSLGAAPAQLLAQGRPGARAALLFHGALPPDTLDRPWPPEVAVEVHAMAQDPWMDFDAARAVVSAASEGALHTYEGSGHLFADPELADYDADAADLMLARVLAFLARIAAR